MSDPIAITINLDNIAPWIAATVIILGWFYNNSKANKRENRKDTRAALDRIQGTVECIKRLSVDYHTSAERRDDIAIEIKSNLSMIGMRISLFEFIGSDESARLLVRVRQSITTNNFDSAKSFARYNRQDPQLIAMTTECDSFIHELEVAYVDYYFHGA